MGHSRPLKPLPPRAKATPPGSGTEMAFMPALFCSGREGAAEASEEPAGHLPLQCTVCLSQCFPGCSSPTHFTRQHSSTVSEPGPQILKCSIQSC